MNPLDFGYVKDGKVYRKGFLDHEDLEVGEVRETDEKSIQYFVDRYDTLVGKIEELEKAVEEAANKGSFLMKLLHMKDKMPEYKGIGDFESLITRLDKIESRLQENIAQNRVKNLEIKTALLEEAERLTDSTEWYETAEKMKELRLNWVRTGAVVEDKQDDMEERFHTAVNNFFELKRKHNEEKRKKIVERSKHYKRLISNVRRLSHEQDKEAILSKIQEIKKEWESVGEIPEKLMRSLEGKLARSIQGLKSQKRRRRIGQAGPPQRGAYRDQRQSFDRGGRPRGDFQGRRNDYQDRSREMTADQLHEMMQEKSRLLSLALEIRDLPLGKSVPLARELQDKWLKSGKSTAPEIRSIYNKFRETIALIFEKNSLEIELKKKYPIIESKSKSEQKIIRISILREMIRRDKSEIKMFEDNLIQSGAMNNQDRQSMALVSRLRGQKFRVKIKESLLQDIELN